MSLFVVVIFPHTLFVFCFQDFRSWITIALSNITSFIIPSDFNIHTGKLSNTLSPLFLDCFFPMTLSLTPRLIFLSFFFPIAAIPPSPQIQTSNFLTLASYLLSHNLVYPNSKILQPHPDTVSINSTRFILPFIS